MKKRILALILASLMLMASCTPAADNGDETDNKTNDAADNTPVEEKTAYELEIERRNGISDELPEVTFDGEEFVIYGSHAIGEFNIVEGYLGETFNDAIYERNLRMESRFDIALNIMPETVGDASMIIKNSVNAGMDEYDLVTGPGVIRGMDFTSEIFLDMRTVPHIDFSKPWWNKSTTDELTINNRTFLAVGSFNIAQIAYMRVMFYNNDMGKAYQREDILDVVLEGRWTADKFEEMTAGIYEDTDGGGEKDAADKFGYCWGAEDLIYFQYAWGKKFIDRDIAGNVVTDRYYDEKLVAICDKLYDYLYSRQEMLPSHTFVDFTMFTKEKTLILAQMVKSYVSILDTDIDYSIIPLPKWDEYQEKYLTAVDGGGDTQTVLKTAGNLEMVGIVTEALNADTWKNVEYAYYERVLKNRGLQDLRNLDVLDMTVEGIIYDFGNTYGGWSWCTTGGGATDWLYSMMIQFKVNNIASWVSGRINNWTKYINGVVDGFVNYKE